jgi:predicted ATP-dependent serine protease
LRLKEISRAGFKQCFIPESNLKEIDKGFDFMIEGFSSLKEVVEQIWR